MPLWSIGNEERRTAQPKHPGTGEDLHIDRITKQTEPGYLNGKSVTKVTSSLSCGVSGKACEGLCVPVGAVPLVSETNDGDGLTFAFAAALTAILIRSGVGDQRSNMNLCRWLSFC